ncbi:hypothetical protein AMAG_05149 [Allomyces macrogynus ATCC 38327]|uniref:Uncharacterized protein n=1 Tax=Allomyces macrogynus (strain ATCC 38327) TaxID=578462 RepID=A0A0L0SB19_ALLM3|nr:hypothetical protein AMAG_05149 [Allomyces macrogynus ATCC 38327]|eukprot:KNE59686.1 hypothetical protein AMAG_05149 [Allomyces macrogynus ATCC 38327]
MGGYRLQGWEVVGARALGTVSTLIAVSLFSWLMYSVFAPNSTTAKTLALGGGGGGLRPRGKRRGSKCDVRSCLSGLAGGVWSGQNARLPMLMLAALLLTIDTVNCFVHLWLDAYPFISMYPDVYPVRLGTTNFMGGILTLIVVRRTMVVAATSSGGLGLWMWRLMLLIYVVLQPVFTWGLAVAILDADARNTWARFALNPLLPLLSLVYPIVSLLCSFEMAVFTLRLGRAMRVGMDSTYQADSSAGGGAPGSEVATFSPDQSSIGGAPASTTVLGSIRATTTAGGSSADKSTGRMPSAITKSNAASRTSAAATDPRPTATGTGFVNRTVATFQLLNAGVMLLWALYLIVQLLGIGSPFTRILLSNTFSGLFVSMEVALKWIMRAGNAIAVRKQLRSSSATASKVATASVTASMTGKQEAGKQEAAGK